MTRVTRNGEFIENYLIFQILLLLCAHYGRSATPDKRELDNSIASPTIQDLAAESDSVGAASIESDVETVSPVVTSHIPTRHTISEQQTRVAIPVPQAIPFSVPRPVPYPVHIPVPVDRPIPVPVSVPHPVAHIIHRPFAVPIDRPFPYPVAHPVPFTVTQGVRIPVPQPYHIPVPSLVPVRIPVGVPFAVGHGVYGSGYGNAVGIGSGFVRSGVSHQPVIASEAVISTHGHNIEHPY